MKCPDCKRPPSERIGSEGDLGARGSWRPGFATPRCKNPIHDLADAGPEMAEALQAVPLVADERHKWGLNTAGGMWFAEWITRLGQASR